jgi:hypothetical protein
VFFAVVLLETHAACRKSSNEGAKKRNSPFRSAFGAFLRLTLGGRYFDELKSLLPPMQDTKFDKNSILVNSITLIKALRTELAAAQTLRCTGAIGDPSQCDCPRDVTLFVVTQSLLLTFATGNEYHEAFARSGMCQAFAGFDGRLWEANLTFCVVLGYR